jgi:hypothetical protein
MFPNFTTNSSSGAFAIATKCRTKNVRMEALLLFG